MAQELRGQVLVPAAALVVIGVLVGTSLGGCQAPSPPPGQTSAAPVSSEPSPAPTIPFLSPPGGKPAPTIEVPPPIR